MKKILLITNIISPTRTTFYNDLSDYLLSQWWELLIIFLSASESNREWDIDAEIRKSKFNYKILESNQLRTWKKDTFYFHINWNFENILNQENAEIVMHDWWASLSAWQAQRWCNKYKKKYILWNESTKYEGSWRRSVTKLLVKYLVKHSDWYISFWTRAKEYLEILWADSSKVCEYYNPIDNDYFINERNKLKNKKQEFKDKYWIKTKFCILFVWQLIQRKWVYDILEWFKIFQTDHKDWSLIFLWWWQEQEKMEQHIKENNMTNIYFPWFIQKDKIGEFYAVADVFTLPSREEVWWLVINEALCFWLPVITATEVWASEDLVIEWKTWYVMKNHSPEEWCKWLNYIIDNNLIDNNQSLEYISKFNNDIFIPHIKIFLD